MKATAEVPARLMAACNGAAAILLISKDLGEILEVADCVAVMRHGAIVHEAPAIGIDAKATGAHMLDAGDPGMTGRQA